MPATMKTPDGITAADIERAHLVLDELARANAADDASLTRAVRRCQDGLSFHAERMVTS